MPLWKSIEKLSDLLEYLLKASLILSLGAIVFFINLAVFFRYVLSSPLSWTNEAAGYLLVYSVLAGAAIALRNGQFVKMEAVSNLLPSKFQTVILVSSQLLVSLFLVICIQSPTMLIQKAILTKTISPALGIPMAFLYRLLRIGFVFMLFFLLINTIEIIINRREPDKNPEKTG